MNFALELWQFLSSQRISARTWNEQGLYAEMNTKFQEVFPFYGEANTYLRDVNTSCTVVLTLCSCVEGLKQVHHAKPTRVYTKQTGR